ncbi:ABC transporter substrate-binding protein [Bordetella genomosp. 9]|nr:ABC transporter substrate-binding protein [Bordetella genomosp. 9]
MNSSLLEEKPTAMSVFFRLAARLPFGQTSIRRDAAGPRPSGPHGLGLFAPAILLVAMLACVALPAYAQAGAAAAAETRRTQKSLDEKPLTVGEINTYRALPGFAEPYRRGWALALAQINAEGGVLGRKLAVVSRDDRGQPDEAVRAAQALVARHGAVALFGSYSSEVAMALSRYALDAKVLYLAVAPLTQRLTWQEGNRYTFRLRPAAWMQAAAVAPKALGLRRLRWAVIRQDTESDRATAEAFKGLMRTFQSKTEFVAEQAVAPQTADARAAVQALAAAKPDALFTMLEGKQLAAFLRAAQTQNLFDGMAVVSLFMGDPENLAAIDTPVPDGWIITGYPRDAIDTPEHTAFVQAYRDRYGEPPGAASVLGYVALRSIAEGLRQAGTADREALVSAFPRLKVPTPFGAIEYRNLDHQSTLGTYLGYTGHGGGQLGMERFVYASGTRLQPLDEQIRRLRDTATKSPSGNRDAAAETHGPRRNGTVAESNGAAGRASESSAGANDAGGRANDAAGGANEAAHSAPASATAGHRVPAALPAKQPDTALTARLRAARPAGEDRKGDRDAALPGQGVPARPAAIEAKDGSRGPVEPHGTAAGQTAAPGPRINAVRPDVDTRTDAVPVWPDPVNPGHPPAPDLAR